MASAVLGDVVTDFVRHPYTMVDVHHSHQESEAAATTTSSPAAATAAAANNTTGTSSNSNAANARQQSFSFQSQHRPTSAAEQQSAQAPAPAASSPSRPIDIPQSARRQQQGTESESADPFAQQRRPPRHDFSADRAYEQLQAAHTEKTQMGAAGLPRTATAAATTALGNSQPVMRAQASSSTSSSSTAAAASAAGPAAGSGGTRSAQHSASASQSSNPPTSPPSPQLLPTIRSSLSMSGNSSPTRIKVRDLNHIQSFASEEVLSRRNSTAKLRGNAGRVDEGGGGGGSGGLAQKYDIASMPVQDIIEMVAGLLTKITSTNDRAHERDIKSHIPNLQNAAAAAAAGVNEPNPAPAGAQPGSSTQQGQNGHVDIRGMHRQTQSVLSFHGKNIPSISILMYLSRIHKYCPTTYEVFLSLLVYFDRMTENINKGIVHSFRNLDPMDADEGIIGSPPSSRHSKGAEDAMIKEEAMIKQEEEEEEEEEGAGKVGVDVKQPIMHPFVVDSFNIHRLIMAGVTCASKFFSDVFYTNSRYAKVGGLPLHELNHLELQFLLLNDFKLFIPISELEHYGSLLVHFYAEEIMGQQIRAKQEEEEREQRETEDRNGEMNGSGEDTADEGVQMQT